MPEYAGALFDTLFNTNLAGYKSWKQLVNVATLSDKPDATVFDQCLAWYFDPQPGKLQSLCAPSFDVLQDITRDLRQSEYDNPGEWANNGQSRKAAHSYGVLKTKYSYSSFPGAARGRIYAAAFQGLFDIAALTSAVKRGKAGITDYDSVNIGIYLGEIHNSSVQVPYKDSIGNIASHYAFASSNKGLMEEALEEALKDDSLFSPDEEGSPCRHFGYAATMKVVEADINDIIQKQTNLTPTIKEDLIGAVRGAYMDYDMRGGYYYR